ncbi:MAG: hypothetical protein ACXV9S_14155 [Acidimicrobiia bacterium]
METADTDDRVARRRFFRSSAGGGLGAVGVFLLILWNNGGLFAGSLFGGFYEIQARAFRHLRWNLPKGALGIEGFVLHHKTFEYYGPWPALLRMPLMLLFPGMDGKWTQPFMLVAFVIALIAVARIAWQVRVMVRGHGVAVSRAECWWMGLFTFGVGTGSVLLFLGSQVWVYHEAEIWGASLSLAAFAALIEFLTSHRWNRLVLASLFATLSINSRASVGFGPIAAVGIVAAATLFPWSSRLLGVPTAFANWRTRIRLGIAALVPVGTYMYVNYSKFGSLFVFPSDKQIFSRVGVYRREMLAQNHNSLFGFKFFPTAAVQYLRPDALRFRSLHPFVDFPNQATVIGKHVLFDTIEPTSSVPSSMPVLAVLALIGLVILVSRRRGAPVAPLRGIALGAFAGAITVVPYSYIAQRYMSDFVPLLVVLASIGLAYAVRYVEGSRRRFVTATTVLVLGVVFAMFVNSALAYSYHYESELVPEGPLTQYVESQYEWHDTLFGGQPPYVQRGDALPRVPSPRGTTFVLGDCGGVYWSQGHAWAPSAKWYALARTEATGQYDLRMQFVGQGLRSVQPVMVRGEPGSIQAIAVDIRPRAVRFGLYSQAHPEWFAHRKTGADRKGFLWGPRIRYRKGKTYPVEVVMDPNNGVVSVVISGYTAFVYFDYGLTTPQLAHFVLPTDHVELGVNTVGAPTQPKFEGAFRKKHQRRPGICKLVQPS